jgi:prepilin-type N-terminal cleavage/methylation domain-containing protein
MRKLVKVIHRLNRSGEKGFTLIELLVVIGILALLAGVVTLGVTQFIGRGAHEAACTDLHNVQTAVAAYMVDSTGNAPPGAVGDLVPEFLLQDPKCDYAIDGSTGAVSNQDCSAYSPWDGKECN